jgi:hypothetical protein
MVWIGWSLVDASATTALLPGNGIIYMTTKSEEFTDFESTDSESEPEWEIRNIIDGKVENGESHFLVDWAPT